MHSKYIAWYNRYIAWEYTTNILQNIEKIYYALINDVSKTWLIMSSNLSTWFLYVIMFYVAVWCSCWGHNDRNKLYEDRGFLATVSFNGSCYSVSNQHQKGKCLGFFQTFYGVMWCMTATSFVMIAVVIWVLEHRVNNNFRGPPRRQLVTMFMWVFFIR